MVIKKHIKNELEKERAGLVMSIQSMNQILAYRNARLKQIDKILEEK